MHITSEPGILYFGTPVVLISTINEDGSYNLAPMSSAFWLGWRCLLGLAGSSKTTENIIRTGECVLNLPSIDNVAAVNRLARTTGSNPIPDGKVRKVSPPRVLECPVQLEATIEAVHGVAEDDDAQRGRIKCIETRIQRVHLEESILMDGEPNRIDPDKWRPLIMSFQNFYGLGPQVHESTLAKIPESLYRGPDIERARAVPRRKAA
jgi:flavin reductase (DIM6/NTAB) family NADH-FMN oxidoreductase RutF